MLLGTTKRTLGGDVTSGDDITFFQASLFTLTFDDS